MAWEHKLPLHVLHLELDITLGVLVFKEDRLHRHRMCWPSPEVFTIGRFTDFMLVCHVLCQPR
jgi:hypothetical protein